MNEPISPKGYEIMNPDAIRARIAELDIAIARDNAALALQAARSETLVSLFKQQQQNSICPVAV